MTRSVRHQTDLPPLLMTSEPGSFARKTIVERKPQIIDQVIEDNGYPPGTVARLEEFKDEIARQLMRPLSEQVPDVTFWNRELAVYRGKGWLEVPWYFAETFFYRRLLEAVGYFQSGPWHQHDPFGVQKQEQIRVAIERLIGDWDSLVGIEPDLVFEALLHSALWGNRADLSNYTVDQTVHAGLTAREERHNLLIDHTQAVCDYLAEGLRQVDFISDNVGLDLLFDLALADLLFHQGRAEKVVFHLKVHPFFVSDAMPRDMEMTLSLLLASPSPPVRRLGSRLEAYRATGCLVLKADPFWTSNLMFRQFPSSLRRELARSDLIVIKGDVNYRRLLEDRHWPHTIPLEEIAADFPSPFLVLRTLKGEIQVGLALGQAEALAAEDPSWLINGRRGIIHFCSPRGRTQVSL